MKDTGSSFIFVYGTLRADIPHGTRMPMAARAHELLAKGADLVATGSMPGKLYSVSWYPGFVPARSKPLVRGEVWRMRDARKLLPGLDAYEGAEYVRDRRTVRLDDGRLDDRKLMGGRVTAWVYSYTGDVARALPIPSGDFLDWVRETT